MGIIKFWGVKKDGRQVKKTFTGKWLNGSPVVKISGQLILIVQTATPDLLPLTLLDLMKEAGAPAVGDVYTEGSAWVERTFYADATPRFIGPRGQFWEWEVLYTIGGVYVDAPPTTGTDETETDETLLNFSTSIELEDFASAADLNGQWNCNSNGEFFADPLVYKTGILNLIYQYREYENPLELSRTYFQTVNASTWHSFPAGTVKCSDISFSATQTTSGTTYETTYKLQYRPRGWTVQKANAGFYYNAGSGVLIRALNDDGSPTNEPVLLNATGGLLTAGAAPIIKPFVVCASADFDALNLPDPFTL